MTAAQPHVRVLRGTPGERELAALLAVLTAFSATQDRPTATRPPRQRSGCGWDDVRYTPPGAWTSGGGREWRQ
ncbi:acyl-CoA carboxylase epsilon subunit [Streptomyces sp. NPDC002521]